MKADEIKPLPALENVALEPVGFGAASKLRKEHPLLMWAKKRVGELADELRPQIASCGVLSDAALSTIVRLLRSGLTTRRRRGRRPSADITAAVADWNAGMRGKRLYEKHIAGYLKLSDWRRRDKGQRLLSAIRTRRRRDKYAPVNKDLESPNGSLFPEQK